MWVYTQSTGNLFNPQGVLVGAGYSGREAGLNNPNLQNHPDLGPIPQGTWIIGKFFDDLGGKGPLVTHLVPQNGTQTFGRSGFMIHGDNRELNHTASEGCIILSHELRYMIATSVDIELQVIA